MTTTAARNAVARNTVAETTSRALPDSPHTPSSSRPAARSRGRLVLEKKVVERIAARAASESGSGTTGGTSGGFLGFGTQTDLTAPPATTVELVGTTATVKIDLSVAYPTPIRTATDQVRRQVVAQVHELTGVEVTRVDIAVTALSLTRAATGREVR